MSDSENNTNLDDGIAIKEIFNAIWGKKIFIFSFTLLAAILSILYALSLQNIYTSEAVLAPANPKNSLSNQLSGFSSLAGIAGINLPQETGGKAQEALERIKSYDFFVEQIIPYIKFENLVAVKEWDRKNNKIYYDNNIFNSDTNKWGVSEATSVSLKPSNQDAYITYSKILSISEDRKNSFVSIRIDHKSPYIAELWLKILIKNINNHMRELDKAVAKNAINFLNESIISAQLAEVKLVISKLLESQIQTLTLAEANYNYIFKPISSPIVPERKSSPKRASICIIGTILGFILSILISIVFYYYAAMKRH
ncbi:Wzz/FepE/Etk N-terminal domain-containing protein [Gammaproteobacteria bacterium]|nr:Wzz/FepE/Etk N-terminal domain-containing protein [Gammaproteobacteria bacterium]